MSDPYPVVRGYLGDSRFQTLIKATISLEEPLVLQGEKGEASALKVVRKHKTRLLKLWNDAPDTQ